jgi:fructose-bisphosphate aldolase, class II
VFAAETNVDALAVAIGSAHGDYAGTPDLDLPRLKKIQEATGSLPLVLHGSSGIPLDFFRPLIESGIAKINMNTDLKRTFLNAVDEALKQNSSRNELQIALAPARQTTKKLTRERIRIFKGLELPSQ